jgi:hypothetical protein
LKDLEIKKSNQIKFSKKELADLTDRLALIENEQKGIYFERLPLFGNDESTLISQEMYTKKAKIKRNYKTSRMCVLPADKA